MNTSHFRTKWLRTSGNFAYVFGMAFLIASLFTSLIPPTVVSAHHANVSGSATCQSNGTYSINWSISNWNDVNGPLTITAINRSIGVSTGTQVDANGVSGSETVSNQVATITLTVSASWSNGNTSTNSGSVNLKGNCYPPPTNTPANTATNTPETPTSTNTPDTPTNTPTDTPTDTPTNTPTDTPTPTITNTPENTSTGTITPTYTPTITDTPTNTPTNTPTDTPTFTPTIDPVGLTFFCTGFRITNLNDFEGPVSYTWSIAGGPSGNTIPLDQGDYEDITTGYYPGLVTVSSPDQQFTASGFLPTNCDENENTPTPTATTQGTPRPTNTPTRRNPTEVVNTLIPDPNITPEILIPVTGVELAGAGSISRMLFNLGIGLLGLGLVLNGLSRNRKEMEI